MVISSSVDGAVFLVATTRSTWRCLITKRLFKTQNPPYFNIYKQESQIANLSNFNKIQSGTVWNTERIELKGTSFAWSLGFISELASFSSLEFLKKNAKEINPAIEVF